MDWLRDNWLKAHLAITPLGTLIVTWVMLLLVGAERWWENRSTLELAGQTVPFGGIVYGSSILVLEVTARMLWALAQRRKDMDQARKEGREVGREEGIEVGREVGREEGIEVGREEGREEGIEVGRERVLLALMERGVELPPDILEELNGSAHK